MWADVAARLAANHRVVVPDLLGFGRSPWPDVAYTPDDHLDALERTLNDLGLDAAVLDIGGHSMGAIIAAEFARRHPGRVNRVVLVSLPYYQTASEVRDTANGLGLLARMTVGDCWGARAACEVMCALRPLFLFLAPRLARGVPPDVARDALRHNYTTYSRNLKNVIMEHSLEGALEALADWPVHLVHGDKDRVVPIENVRPLTGKLPGWQLVVVPGGGHLLPIERPDEVVRLLAGETGVGCSP